MSAVPTAEDFAAKKASTGFSCDMDGYTSMVLEITELLLIVITLYKEIIVAILPNDLGLALKFYYQGLTGVSKWSGYAVAALYFLAEDQGFGDQLCEVSGYGDIVVDTLYQLVDFGNKDETAATTAWVIVWSYE